ncbi:MAG: HIT domain-containing protein [Elusimicrobiota bacterium]
MSHIFAPWRKKYILSKQKDCFFCKAIKEKKDKKNLVLYRGKTAFVILNKFPYNAGHLMVATYRHIGKIEKLRNCEIVEIMQLVKKMVILLKKKMNPQGFNIGINLGKIAGSGVEKHFHLHIVPRWQGDTNFMPMIAKTKVVSQSIKELYYQLKKHNK